MIEWPVPMDQLKTILGRVLQRRGLYAKAEAAHVSLKAQQWIGEHLPAFKDDLIVTTLQHGTLTMRAKHSIAAQECQQQLPALQQFLHREFPDIVQEVRLQRT